MQLNNLTIKEAFAIYSIEIKANMLRGHLRKIYHTYLSLIYSDLSQFLFYLTAPNNLDLNCNMDIENLFSETVLNTKLGFLGEIIDYYITQIESFIPFIKLITNFEFALNFNKLFIDTRIKLR